MRTLTEAAEQQPKADSGRILPRRYGSVLVSWNPITVRYTVRDALVMAGEFDTLEEAEDKAREITGRTQPDSTLAADPLPVDSRSPIVGQPAPTELPPIGTGGGQPAAQTPAAQTPTAPATPAPAPTTPPTPPPVAGGGGGASGTATAFGGGTTPAA